MPRHDRTGPMGTGPLTDGGFGDCQSGAIGRIRSSFAGINAGGSPQDAGRGVRGGMGRGSRLGAESQTDSYEIWDMPEWNPDELGRLRNYAKAMETKLSEVRKRVAEIEEAENE